MIGAKNHVGLESSLGIYRSSKSSSEKVLAGVSFFIADSLLGTGLACSNQDLWKVPTCLVWDISEGATQRKDLHEEVYKSFDQLR